MRKKIMKKTTQKIMAIIIIMIICNFIMSTKVFAGYGAKSQDPGASSGNSQSSGQNVGTIMDAVTAGVSPNTIKEKIKSQLNVSDDIVNKIYTNCYNDSTKITVSYTYVSTTGLVTLNSVSTSGVSQEDINKMTDGSYVANGGSQTATAGGNAPGTDGETASSGSYNQKVSEQEGADEGNDFGVLFGPLANLIQGIGDSINKILQSFIIGDKSPVFYNSGFFSSDNVQEVVTDNLPVSGLPEVTVVKDYIDTWSGKYGVPDIKLTPAEIFAGKVSAFDANFFKTSNDHSKELGGEEKSIVEKLGNTVAKWYVALRNIAIVGLLSALLYIGIRIIISSSNAEKAKYKQFFVDWVVALCLIFFLHYIMAFTMTMSETVTDVLAGQGNTDKKDSNGRIKQVNIKLVGRDGETQFSDSALTSFNVYFSSNFTGVARIKADYKGSALRMGYSILYLALTVYTAYFSFVYIKRLLMLAFFTMIAPLVALTYPLDKIKDGKSQAFDYWFREYMFYALLQPLHMLLYTVFVSSALEIASNNLLYSIVVMAFIVPAEKIIKEMFGIKGKTESTLGGFAGGALASQAFNMIKKGPTPQKSGGNSGNAGKGTNNNIRTNKNPNVPSAASTLATTSPGTGVPMLGQTGNSQTGGGLAGGTPVGGGTTGGGLAGGTPVGGGATGGGNPFAAVRRAVSSGASPIAAIGSGVTAGVNQFQNARRQIKDRVKKAASTRYKNAGGAKGIAKSFGKTAAKTYGRAFTTLGMGALGLGVGIVGGDMSDTIKGLGAGVTAGYASGGKLNNAVANIGNSALGSFAKDVLYGDDRARHDFVKSYMNDRENRTRLVKRNPNADMKQINSMLRQRAEMSFDSGIDDAEVLDRAVDMKGNLDAQNPTGATGTNGSHGVNYDRTIAYMKLAGKYSDDVFDDDKKEQKAQKRLATDIEKKLSGSGQSQAVIKGKAKKEAADAMNMVRTLKGK